MKVTNWWTARRARVSGAGAMAQPTFQPVTLKVLPMLSIEIVRSRMPGERRDGDVGGAVEGDLGVDLVADHDGVVLAAERRQLLELLAREDLAGRVVGRVQDDGARARAEGGGAARRGPSASRAGAAPRGARRRRP